MDLPSMLNRFVDGDLALHSFGCRWEGHQNEHYIKDKLPHEDEIKGFHVLNMPGLQLALIDSNRFMVHQAGTQKQICSASRKHSIMKNPNCSIPKRMDTAPSRLLGRSTRWRRGSILWILKLVHKMPAGKHQIDFCNSLISLNFWELGKW